MQPLQPARAASAQGQGQLLPAPAFQLQPQPQQPQVEAATAAAEPAQAPQQQQQQEQAQQGPPALEGEPVAADAAGGLPANGFRRRYSRPPDVGSGAAPAPPPPPALPQQQQQPQGPGSYWPWLVVHPSRIPLPETVHGRAKMRLPVSAAAPA